MRQLNRLLGSLKVLRISVLLICLLGHKAYPAVPVSETPALTVAFLFNFIKLSEWPPDVITSDITLCEFYTDSDTIDLSSLSGKDIQSYRIKIKTLLQGDTIEGCHLLYIPDNEKPIRVQEWLKNIANSPVLTVSSMKGFLDEGGMIELIQEEKRLQFEVNLAPVERVKIKLSSKMLQIARDVRGR